MPSGSPIQVLIVEDHEIVAESLRLLLASENDLVPTVAHNAARALALAERQPFEVVLLDFHLPDGIAANVIRALRALRPEARVVMLSGDVGEDAISEAVAAGAVGYLSKTAEAHEMIDAVRRAAAGRVLLSAAGLLDLMRHEREREAHERLRAATIASLTRREREILRLMTAGLSNLAIAERLVLSEETVRMHVRNVLRKLAVHSRVAAVATAIRLRIDDRL